MIDTIWIIIGVLLVVGLLMSNCQKKEGFDMSLHKNSCGIGRGCGIENAKKMCRELAQSNCRIPNYPLDECWINEYEKCNEYSEGNTEKSCDCYDVAAEKCGSDSCPAEACFRDSNQKCLAGFGYAVDPDRGAPHGLNKCN
jgi:hypothetical protein